MPCAARPLQRLLVAAFAVVLFAANAAGTSETSQLAVSTDFPGGSGEVQAVDQEKRLIQLVPTSHKDRGWACWWYVKVAGIAPGETIKLDVGDTKWATPERATYSVDGKTWQHTAPGRRNGNRVTYEQKIDTAEAWFAWGPPFVPADAEALCRRAAKGCERACAFELCRTREDRSVPALHFRAPLRDKGRSPDAVSVQKPFGICITARQHAWEAGSSWVCAGLVEWLASDDARAVELRRKADIYIVPIMDIDNVAIGAGGKEQQPQDHNRDWSDQPYHRSVAAVQSIIKRLDDEERFDLFIDLHNPGPSDRDPYFYISPRSVVSDGGWANLNRFLDIARTEITGPLCFRGETKESGASYDRNWERISKNWVTRHTADHVVSLTLETAWNTPASTVDGYRQVGRELGLAIERYCREDPRGKRP